MKKKQRIVESVGCGNVTGERGGIDGLAATEPHAPLLLASVPDRLQGNIIDTCTEYSYSYLWCDNIQSAASIQY